MSFEIEAAETPRGIVRDYVAEKTAKRDYALCHACKEALVGILQRGQVPHIAAALVGVTDRQFEEWMRIGAREEWRMQEDGVTEPYPLFRPFWVLAKEANFAMAQCDAQLWDSVLTGSKKEPLIALKVLGIRNKKFREPTNPVQVWQQTVNMVRGMSDADLLRQAGYDPDEVLEAQQPQPALTDGGDDGG